MDKQIKPTNGMQRSAVACGKQSNMGIEQARFKLESFYEKLKLKDNKDIMDNFIWFINEREKIRKLKEQGSPRPYTDDEVLHKTKFTNIFREDDRVSKFIFEKLNGLGGHVLFYNLLIARLLNRTDVLSLVLPTTPQNDLSFLLDNDKAIMNSAAYQISPGVVRGSEKYTTVREYIIYETPKRYLQAYNEMLKGKTVSEASSLCNKGFGGHIPFTMFQVVLDWNYLIGGFEDSPLIRVGQGAKATIDALMGTMEQDTSARTVKPEVVDITPIIDNVNKIVERHMKPSDVEHACCEYRKYLQRQGKNLSHYSYKPNSMGV